MNNILDIDSVDTWHADFKELIYTKEMWTRILTKLDDVDIKKEFLHQIACEDDSLKDPIARHLRENGKKIFLKRYSHVTSYHGCRPRDIKSYCRDGIRLSNTSALIAEARDLFDGIDGFEQAIEDIGLQYINHNEGKIGLLISESFARRPKNNYVDGSELIHSIANRLGEEAKNCLACTGSPTVIKCKIPIDWLDSYTTFPMCSNYVNILIEGMIWKRKWPEENSIGNDSGYMIIKAIPPQNIIEFINMTDY